MSAADQPLLRRKECRSGQENDPLSVYFLAPMLFLAFVRITTSYFYATEKNVFSYILVYAEPIFTLLLLLLLPPRLQLAGVWLAVPLAQTITFVIALIEKRVAERC